MNEWNLPGPLEVQYFEYKGENFELWSSCGEKEMDSYDYYIRIDYKGKTIFEDQILDKPLPFEQEELDSFGRECVEELIKNGSFKLP